MNNEWEFSHCRGECYVEFNVYYMTFIKLLTPAMQKEQSSQSCCFERLCLSI